MSAQDVGVTERAQLRRLLDEAAIHALMLRFGRALDRHDWVLYRSCFLEEIAVDFEDLTGLPVVRVSADRWTAFAEAALGPVRCLHRYTNHAIEVSGDQARSTLYMEANHFRPTARGGAENTQHGWYENEYVRSDGAWRIAKLGQKLAWISGNEGVLDLHTPAVQAAFQAVFGEHT